MFSAFLALSALAMPQSTPRVEVLRSNIPSDSTAAIPGYPGIDVTSFREIAISPSGRSIVLATSAGSTPNHFVLIDDGGVLAHGEAAPWTGSDAMVLSYSNADVGVNDAGHYFVSTLVNEAAGGQRVWIARRTAAGWTGLYDSKSAIPGVPGVFFSFFGQLNGLANGDVAFSSSVRGVPSDTSKVLLQPPTILDRIGVTGPADPVTGVVHDVWSTFNADEHLLVTPDGLHRLVRAPVSAHPNVSNEIVAFDGIEVLGEQKVLPGSAYTDPVGSVMGLHLAPDGTWSVFGSNDPPGSASPDEHWVVRNGAVVAESGDPILPGDSRAWHDGQGVTQAFFLAASNGIQNYLGGYAKDSITNDLQLVVVLEGDQVVLRAGDPIDLDGNGLFDDDLEFQGFSGSRWATVDRQGRLWMMALLKQSSGTKTYEALLRVSADPIQLVVPPLTAGAAATIEVQDATPGHTAVVLYSTVSGGPSSFPTGLGTLAFEVGTPFATTPMIPVPASGTASFSVTVPGALAGLPIWAQAAVYDAAGAKLSRGYTGAIN